MVLTYEVEPVKPASSCRRWIIAICHATTSMHWNNEIKTRWIVCHSTRGFGVSTRTVKSCLTQSRWMGETCVVTEVTRWTRTTAEGVCQMKTNTTEIVLNKENVKKKCFSVYISNISVHPPVRVHSYGAGQRETGALRTIASLWTCSSHSCAEITIWIWKIYT